MISGFVHFLQGLVSGTGFGMGTLFFVTAACTGIGLFMVLFKFIKSFNIFN